MQIKQLDSCRAQIGVTITWMVAFIIIFFIMLLFTTTTILIAKAREIPVIGSGGSKSVIIGGVPGNLEVQENFDNFLFSETEDIFVFEYIKKADFDHDYKSFDKILNDYFNFYNSCYAFCIFDKTTSNYYLFYKQGCWYGTESKDACLYLNKTALDRNIARAYFENNKFNFDFFKEAGK